MAKIPDSSLTAPTADTVYYGTSPKKKVYKSLYSWYLAPKDDQANIITSLVNKISDAQTLKQRYDLRHARLYSNTLLSSFSPYLYTKYGTAAAGYNAFANKMHINLIKAVIDTLTSKIGKTSPRVTFLTNGASYKTGKYLLRKQNKDLAQFFDAYVSNENIYAKGIQTVTDCLIFGSGFIYLYSNPNIGWIEPIRVTSPQILIDDADGVDGNPSQVTIIFYQTKEKLCEEFPDKEELIAKEVTMTDNDSVMEYVEVRHSYFINKKFGKKLISTKSGILLEEPYKEDFLPLVKLDYTPRGKGYFASGIAELLAGIQAELNDTTFKLQTAMNLFSSPKVLVDRASNVNQAHLNNNMRGIIEYSNVPPSFWQGAGLSGDFLSYIQYLWQQGFEVSGVSQLSAASQKPAGLNSGQALRDFQDIESERFAAFALAYQNFYIDMAKKIIKLFCSLDKAGKLKDKDLTSPNHEFLKEINFKGINYSGSDFLVQPFATSVLAKSPAARLEEVKEMEQAGYLTKEDAIELMDYPDVQEFRNEKLAPKRAIAKILSQIIYDRDSEIKAPSDFMNIDLAVYMVQMELNRGEELEYPPEVMADLEDYLSLCLNIKNQKNEEIMQEAMELEQAQAMLAQANAEGQQLDMAMEEPLTDPTLMNSQGI